MPQVIKFLATCYSSNRLRLKYFHASDFFFFKSLPHITICVLIIDTQSPLSEDSVKCLPTASIHQHPSSHKSECGAGRLHGHASHAVAQCSSAWNFKLRGSCLKMLNNFRFVFCKRSSVGQWNMHQGLAASAHM